MSCENETIFARPRCHRQAGRLAAQCSRGRVSWGPARLTFFAGRFRPTYATVAAPAIIFDRIRVTLTQRGVDDARDIYETLTAFASLMERWAFSAVHAFPAKSTASFLFRFTVSKADMKGWPVHFTQTVFFFIFGTADNHDMLRIASSTRPKAIGAPGINPIPPRHVGCRLCSRTPTRRDQARGRRLCWRNIWRQFFKIGKRSRTQISPAPYGSDQNGVLIPWCSP